MSYLRKFVCGFLIVCFLTSSFLLPAQKARADWSDIAGPVLGAGVSCLVNMLIGELTGELESLDKVPINDNSTNSLDKKISCLNVVAKAAAQIILKKVTLETVAWINNGFKGTPFYVQDTQSLFHSIADGQLTTYLGGLVDNTNPFKKDVARSLIQNYTGFNRPGFTLDQQIGSNWADFDNDFSVGGWDGFLAATQNDDNNPIGTELLAKKAASGKIASTQQAQRDELNQNQGFLSYKKCADDSYQELPAEYSRVELTLQAQGDQNAPETSQAQSLLQQYPECSGYETKTPGTVIADKLTQAVNSPEQQLVNANDLNESLTAVFTALLTQLFNKGVSDLSSGKTFTPEDGSGGYGSNSGYTGTGTSGGTTGQSNWYQTQEFDITTDLPGVIANQQAYKQALVNYNILLSNIMHQLDELDFCIPGPSKDWQPRAQSYVDHFIDSGPAVLLDSDNNYQAMSFDVYLGFLISNFSDAVPKSQLHTLMNNTLDLYKQKMDYRYYSNDALINRMPPVTSIARQEIAKHDQYKRSYDKNLDAIAQIDGIIHTLQFLETQVHTDPNNIPKYLAVFFNLPIAAPDSVTKINTKVDSLSGELDYIVSLITSCKDSLNGPPYNDALSDLHFYQNARRLPPGLTNDYNLPTFTDVAPEVDLRAFLNGENFYGPLPVGDPYSDDSSGLACFPASGATGNPDGQNIIHGCDWNDPNSAHSRWRGFEYYFMGDIW